MLDVARCGNCAFAGIVRLNSSRRRVTTDPKVYCSHWKKESHPFGVCPDHEAKPDATTQPDSPDSNQLSAL